MKHEHLPCHPDLESLIRSLFQGSDVKVTLLDGSIKGLGGGSASDSNKAVVTVDGGPDIRIFIKCCKEGSQAMYYDTHLDTFGKEIAFYQKILPRLQQEAQDGFGDLFPKCFGAGRTQSGDICVMFEDFAAKNYTVVPKEESIAYDNVKRSMEGLAKFHSLSMGKLHLLEDKEGALEDRLFCKEGESRFSKFFCKAMAEHVKLLIAVVEEVTTNGFDKVCIPKSVSRELLEKIVSMAPQNMAVLGHLRSVSGGHLDLVIHGDFHMWNVAFDESGSMTMFDFQELCKGGSPACDLHHFLSQAVTSKERRLNSESWLQAYCQELAKHVGIKLSYDDLMKEFKKVSPIGLIFGLLYVLLRYVQDYDVFQKAKDATCSKEKVDLLGRCTSPKIWTVVQDLLELVEEYQQLGAIDIMEDLINCSS